MQIYIEKAQVISQTLTNPPRNSLHVGSHVITTSENDMIMDKEILELHIGATQKLCIQSTPKK